MSATITNLRPALTPLQRVQRMPTQSERLLAASVELTALTQMVEELTEVVEATAKYVTDPATRDHLLSIAATARKVITS